MKPKKCRVCKEAFTQSKPLQTCCGIKCAILDAAKKREKKERKETKERKRKLLDNDRAHWTAKAQKAFNAWIRKRDEHLPCVSCGCPPSQGKRNAGHYRPAGINTALRFDPRNCHSQCERCNTSLSGNLIPYRLELINRIGFEAVDWLDHNHDIKRWSIAELKEIESHYRQKVKDN